MEIKSRLEPVPSIRFICVFPAKNTLVSTTKTHFRQRGVKFRGIIYDEWTPGEIRPLPPTRLNKRREEKTGDGGKA
jgi:hypothetical protein